MSKKILLIVGCIAFVLTLSSAFLLIRRDSVGSFDSLYETQNECTPYNVFVEKGEEEFSVVIKWKTVGKCAGFVQYGSDRNQLDRVAFDLEGNLKSSEHSVVIKKLLTKSKYYFLINSESKGYGNNGVPLEFMLSGM